jgi:hypothetical protein
LGLLFFAATGCAGAVFTTLAVVAAGTGGGVAFLDDAAAGTGGIGIDRFLNRGLSGHK